MISDTFNLEIEGRFAKTLGLGGPGVSVRVYPIPPDQLAEVLPKAFSVFVVGSRHMPRLVKCAASAVEGEDHRHSKPFGPVVSLPASNDTAEDGGKLRAQEPAAHVVVAAAFDKRNIFGGVVFGATVVVLQIGLSN